MAGVGGEIVNKFMKTATKESFKAKVASNVSNFPGDRTSSAKKAAANFAGTVFDICYDAAVQGNVSRATLFKAIAKTSVSLAGLSGDQKAECLGSLIDMGLYGTEISEGIALVAGEEFASAGLATPIVALQATLMTKTVVDLANASVKANQQCGPLAVEGYNDLTNAWGDLVVRGEEAFAQAAKSLEDGVTATVTPPGMVTPPP